MDHKGASLRLTHARLVRPYQALLGLTNLSRITGRLWPFCCTVLYPRGLYSGQSCENLTTLTEMPLDAKSLCSQGVHAARGCSFPACSTSERQQLWKASTAACQNTQAEQDLCCQHHD